MEIQKLISKEIIKASMQLKLGPGDLYKLLKKNKITIKELAKHTGLTMKRIREVNKKGAKWWDGSKYLDLSRDYIEAVDRLKN